MHPVHQSLPAGPRGSLQPTLQLIRDPRQALTRWSDEYGDPFLLHAMNGPVVVTGREDLIRSIYGNDPDIYAPFATATLLPMMGSGSLFVLDGDEHRRERRLIMPMFHGDRMKAYGNAIQQIALEQIEHYRRAGTVPTLKLMTDISLETIVRTIFGASRQETVSALMRASSDVVAKSNPLLFFTRRSHIPFFGWSPWDRWNYAKRSLFERLDQIIEERQRESESHDDVLSLLCNATYEDGELITREHIHSELMTMLFAGHETTALTLTWAVYHLLTHEEVRKKLRDELDLLPDNTASALASSPYLKAVVQETLRMHPIVTETLRKLKAPMHLGDYVVPEGYCVAAATVLVHHNPDLYPDPENFQPQRFIDRSYSPFQYMPFGGGHRRCIGAAFAAYEMAIVLGTLFKRFEFELLESKPVVPKRRNVTIGPSSSVPIRFKDRIESVHVG